MAAEIHRRQRERWATYAPRDGSGGGSSWEERRKEIMKQTLRENMMDPDEVDINIIVDQLERNHANDEDLFNAFQWELRHHRRDLPRYVPSRPSTRAPARRAPLLSDILRRSGSVVKSSSSSADEPSCNVCLEPLGKLGEGEISVDEGIKRRGVILPCGHAKTCFDCVAKQQALGGQCPLCRGDIMTNLDSLPFKGGPGKIYTGGTRNRKSKKKRGKRKKKRTKKKRKYRKNKTIRK